MFLCSTPAVKTCGPPGRRDGLLVVPHPRRAGWIEARWGGLVRAGHYSLMWAGAMPAMVAGSRDGSVSMGQSTMSRPLTYAPSPIVITQRVFDRGPTHPA